MLESFKDFLNRLNEQEIFPAGLEEGLRPELKELLNQYKSLSKEKQETEPFLWWMLQKSTAYFKMTKEVANYTDNSASEDQSCSNCRHIYKGQRSYICDQVGLNAEGNDDINPSGWCKLWKQSEGNKNINE